MSAVRVTRFSGASFLHVKPAEWGNPPNRDNQITAPKPVKPHGRTTWLPTATSSGEIFRRFHLQNRQNADEIDTAGDNLSVESDSQAYQRNQTDVLPATTTLKRKEALSEQTKKTNVSSSFMCVFSDRAIVLQFGPHPASPGLYVKTSIFLPRVGEVPHLLGVPRFHVNRL